jgi:hypothetical protein
VKSSYNIGLIASDEFPLIHTLECQQCKINVHYNVGDIFPWRFPFVKLNSTYSTHILISTFMFFNKSFVQETGQIFYICKRRDILQSDNDVRK